jgi:signal transduction histidine kinase
VRGDRVQLQQVILNLVINGLEAIAKNKNGERELSISSGIDDSKDMTIAVRDTGEGLDPANLERVFDAFFTTKADGMGMGLAISRTIIESHGGRLWATPNSPAELSSSSRFRQILRLQGDPLELARINPDEG